MNTISRCPQIAVFLLMPFLGLSFLKVADNQCIDAERNSLEAFKQGLTDPSGRLSSWTGPNCCEWSGIGCDNKTGIVIKIDLKNPYPTTNFASTGTDSDKERSCLGGELDSSLLGLKYLEHLDLSLNDFKGTAIPEFIGMFQDLKFLNLSSASFGGYIPHSIGNLSKLIYLDLYADSYVRPGLYESRATDFQWLSGLSSLKHLNMGHIKYDDAGGYNWLSAVNSLPSLVELHLQSCHLVNIPSSLPFVNFTSLSVLDLSSNTFNSTIPQWIFNLTSLTKLDLSRNTFRGVMSDEFAKLTSLEYLDLSGNYYIEGTIPSVLGKLCQLRVLSLSFNSLTGGMEALLSQSSDCPESELITLDLSDNQLEGEIPGSLGTLVKLRLLNLNSNWFSGSIPGTVGSMSSLQHLGFSYNIMNGTIPATLGELSDLVELKLDGNHWNSVVTDSHFMNLHRLERLSITESVKSLVFNFTYDWIPPFRLTYLALENCLVGPRFPVWIQLQSELADVTLRNVGIEDAIPGVWFVTMSAKLEYLDFSRNKIKGTLPGQVKFSKVVIINMSYNQLEGSFPLWYTNATHIYLESNLMSGPIPSNISDLMPELVYLRVSKNRLNGTIPPSICTIKSLEILDLNSNRFSGELPRNWSELQNLWVLDVANNDLSGKIPNSIGCLSSLTILMLSNNHLKGKIPPSLQNCSSLRTLDLGGNRLSGNLPLWIGETEKNGIWRISLRSNSFSGVIPEKWCNLRLIHFLDLARNNISGHIPSCIGNLNSMTYNKTLNDLYNKYGVYSDLDEMDFDPKLYYDENILVSTKGRELMYNTTLLLVKSIDLSGNNLTGEIPESVANLTALGTLNLSRNHLSGSIPEKIGSLRLIETLDLSNNELSGTIPLSTSSLTLLTHLNLANNKLEGRIPTGNQLQTLNDPSIYEGNPGLCGAPLTNKCRTGEDDSSVPNAETKNSDDDDDGDENEMFGFYVSMGLGFFVGAGGVCCTIWRKETWRNAFFRLLGFSPART